MFPARLAALALLAVALPAGAATRFVDAATGVDAGGCTVPASPCKTVTYAMGQAAPGGPGDAIQVGPGSYGIALGEIFPIVVKSGVQLRATGSAVDTILDASGANKRVLELPNANSSTVIEGFTITGGAVEGGTPISIGGAMTIDGGAPAIRRNVIVNNAVRGTPGGEDIGKGTATPGGEARGGAIHGARGPSIGYYVQDYLANPSLELFSGGTPIAQNDDWKQASNAAQIQTTGFAPLSDSESAILITLAPGAYTAVVNGVGGTSGVAIVEVFKN